LSIGCIGSNLIRIKLQIVFDYQLIITYLLVLGLVIGLLFLLVSLASRSSENPSSDKDQVSGMIYRGAEVIAHDVVSKSVPANIRSTSTHDGRKNDS